jgi:hypothetical protein
MQFPKECSLGLFSLDTFFGGAKKVSMLLGTSKNKN